MTLSHRSNLFSNFLILIILSLSNFKNLCKCSINTSKLFIHQISFAGGVGGVHFLSWEWTIVGTCKLKKSNKLIKINIS